MSAIGPDLPPHLLAKRKRREDDNNNVEPASSAEAEDKRDSADKRRRVIGPAMPPAALDERPEDDPDSNDSDDDDEYGPSMPSAVHGKAEDTHDAPEQTTDTSPKVKAQRDEWMIMAPAQDDLAARMDPSRVRARGFNTGRSAREGGNKSDGPSSWHETAAQKQERLANELLGIKDTAPTSKSKTAQLESERTKELAREHKASNRGPSLMDQHREREPEQAEDDISKRAFDREKDMGSGSRISGSHKREMLNKASGYSSRFAGGSYL